MIIITGISGGIGSTLLELFNHNGYPVIGTYNRRKPELPNSNNLYQLDITDTDDVNGWVNSIKEQLKDIVLINCAGITYNSFAHKADALLWKKVIDVNLFGTFNVARAILPLMREQKYGRIINFASVTTKLPVAGASAYIASKAGVIGLTKSLAKENGRLGITTNAINLGYIDSGMGIESISQEFRATMETQIPLGRFGNVEEIYRTIQYIIETEYLNGAVLDLNGGLI